mgnify:CR=1
MSGNKLINSLSDTEIAQMKEECYDIYVDCMRKYTKLLFYLHFSGQKFNSDTGFLNVSNKDDYKFYTQYLKNLSEALEPLRKHFGIR